MKDIKEAYTITEYGATKFNTMVKQIINDLQSDNLTVEVQFSTTEKNGIIYYSAMVIGRKK